MHSNIKDIDNIVIFCTKNQIPNINFKTAKVFNIIDNIFVFFCTNNENKTVRYKKDLSPGDCCGKRIIEKTLKKLKRFLEIFHMIQAILALAQIC